MSSYVDFHLTAFTRLGNATNATYTATYAPFAPVASSAVASTPPLLLAGLAALWAISGP
jgi:hypothetical protein